MMKCEICGRDYIALGVHLRHKHKIDPDEYRDEFGLLRSTPLVDSDLSKTISDSAKSRLLDEEYKKEMQELCRRNAQSAKGGKSSGMGPVGRAALAERNKKSNQEYLAANAHKVVEVLKEKKTLLAVRREFGTGAAAALKMAEIAGFIYSVHEAKDERKRLAIASKRKKTMAGVAKLMAHFDTSRSASEMCRLAGVSLSCYKNWLKAGLIQRHPNGRFMRSGSALSDDSKDSPTA